MIFGNRTPAGPDVFLHDRNARAYDTRNGRARSLQRRFPPLDPRWIANISRTTSVSHFKTFTNVAFQWKWIPSRLQQLRFYSARGGAVSFEFNAFAATWNSLDFTGDFLAALGHIALCRFMARKKREISKLIRKPAYIRGRNFWFRTRDESLTRRKLKRERNCHSFPMTSALIVFRVIIFFFSSNFIVFLSRWLTFSLSFSLFF